MRAAATLAIAILRSALALFRSRQDQAIVERFASSSRSTPIDLQMGYGVDSH